MELYLEKYLKFACGGGDWKNRQLLCVNYFGVFEEWLSVIGGEFVIPDVDSYSSHVAN